MRSRIAMRWTRYTALLVLAAACSSGDNPETGATGGASDTGTGGAAGSTGATMTDTMMTRDTMRGRDSMMRDPERRDA
jgi:hypothetical protein